MEQLVFTALLNRWLGAPVLALLLKLTFIEVSGDSITNSFAMELLVAVLLTIFFIGAHPAFGGAPGGLQHDGSKSTDLSTHGR